MEPDRLENHIRFGDPAVPSNTDVFETFLVMENGTVFMLDEHLERMKRSVTELELGEAPDIDRLGGEILELADKDEFRNRVLRLEYSSDPEGHPNLSVHVREKSEIACSDRPLRLIIPEAGRNPKSLIVSHKTGNYLENRISLKRAVKRGFDDALFLNVDRLIAETTSGNIFIVRDQTLITPNEESGILPGIVRSWVIENARRMGIVVLVMPCDVEELRDAEEVFVTNSVIGIRSVSEIVDDDTILFSLKGATPMTDRILGAYRDALSGLSAPKSPPR